MLITDPYDIALDPVSGDIYFEAGELPLIAGYEAIKQAIDINLSMFLAEWFLNQDEGSDWFSILGHRYNPVTVAGVVRKAILKAPQVVSITSLMSTLNPETRKLEVVWTVLTSFDDTPVSGTSEVA